MTDTDTLTAGAAAALARLRDHLRLLAAGGTTVAVAAWSRVEKARRAARLAVADVKADAEQRTARLAKVELLRERAALRLPLFAE